MTDRYTCLRIGFIISEDLLSENFKNLFLVDKADIEYSNL